SVLIPSEKQSRLPTLVGWLFRRDCVACARSRKLSTSNPINRMKKILVIEDQAPMRRNIALLLELEGFEVLTAANGALGITAARKERPDLVVCDVMMPELDGYAVVQALRADAEFATLPFIFLTARGDKTDIRIGMNFGADDYLTKPVIREDLLAAVQTRLARAQAVEQRVERAASEAGGFHPDFSSPGPLQRALGLT